MLRFVWSGRQILTIFFWYVSWCGLYWLSSATAWVIKEQNTLKCRLHSQDIYPSYFFLKQPQLYQNLLTALEIASSGSICSHVSIYVKAWPDTQLHPMAALVFHICRSRTIRRPLAAALVWNLSKAWQKSGSWIFYTLHFAKLEETNDTLMISQNNLSNASPRRPAELLDARQCRGWICGSIITKAY